MAEVSPTVAPEFEWRAMPAGRVLVSTALASIARHLFSTRLPSAPGTGEPDYRSIAACFDVPASDICRVRQVHGRDVLIVRPGDPTTVVDADAVVSIDPGRVASVRVADCVPILLADRRGRAVAAVHAGWRGTAAGVVVAAVEALDHLGVSAADLVAAIGPSIGPCCYQVDTVVRDAFLAHSAETEGWFTADADRGRWRLDLWRANQSQLESCGIKSIHTAAACTADGLSHWYSFRKEGAAAGRMVAAIRLQTV
jgi:YfiH family protein